MAVRPHPGALRLAQFDPRYAATIAAWVDTPEALQLLAPSTEPPLTAGKVMRWPQPGGLPFVLLDIENHDPVAYGELNPMRRAVGRYWLGHIIVAPQYRGDGLGVFLVEQLVAHATDSLRATKLSLVVFPGNEAAIACYLRCGFINTGDEYHRFNGKGPEYRLLRFELDLDPS